MKRYRISVVGLSPYMQHKMNDQALAKWEKNRGKIMEREGIDESSYSAALFACHLCPETRTNPDGSTLHFHFIPTDHFKQSFIEASKQHKAKVGGASRSMKAVVSGGFTVERAKSVPPEVQAKLPRDLSAYKFNEIPFPPFDEVDERSAVNNKIKGRLIVKRPKWREWGCMFDLIVSEHTITIDQISAIIKTAGEQIGVGSYRPQHTGEFGRFKLHKIELIGEEEQREVDTASKNVFC